jgi:hypothetical protein
MGSNVENMSDGFVWGDDRRVETVKGKQVVSVRNYAPRCECVWRSKVIAP